MIRPLVLLAGLAAALLAAPACAADADDQSMGFSLARSGVAGQVQITMTSGWERDRFGEWSQTIAVSELQGLDPARLAARETSPARFTVVRPAGRMDCAGSVASDAGGGSCRFTADEAFADMLARRGFDRPSLRQSYALTMGGFRPEVLDALKAEGYPLPRIDDLVPLGIFRIGPDYVHSLAGAGYRLGSVHQLISFKIFNITPDWIEGFEKIGLHHVAPEKLVQMKIFGVTPQFVQDLKTRGVASASPDDLVRWKMFGPGVSPRPWFTGPWRR